MNEFSAWSQQSSPRRSFTPTPIQIEYKAIMNDTDVIAYEWAAGPAVLKFDFHGEPAGGPEGARLSFEKGRESKAAGRLRAPFAGPMGGTGRTNPTSRS